MFNLYIFYIKKYYIITLMIRSCSLPKIGLPKVNSFPKIDEFKELEPHSPAEPQPDVKPERPITPEGDPPEVPFL